MTCLKCVARRKRDPNVNDTNFIDVALIDWMHETMDSKDAK